MATFNATTVRIVAGIVLLPLLLVLGTALYALLNLFAAIVLFLVTVAITASLGLVAWAMIEEKFIHSGKSRTVYQDEKTTVVEVDYTVK
jgi:hypothetical protein